MLTLQKRMLLLQRTISFKSMNDEDLGSPVVKPTDSNPDSTKKVKQVSDAVSKICTSKATITLESRI